MNQYPIWMDEAGLLAKSAEMGGQTLAQHTREVLERLADQVRLRPQMPSYLDNLSLWRRLYWGCFLHDFGKAAVGFQNVLRKQPDQWSDLQHRHEVLSLGFVDWLFPEGHPDRTWVIAVIACHHKDANDYKFTKYGGHKALQDMPDDERETMRDLLENIAAQIDDQTKALLWRWIDTCGSEWAAQLEIPIGDMPLLLPQREVAQRDLKKAILGALSEFHRWRKTCALDERRFLILARGLILTADHAASAETGRFPDMQLDMATVEALLEKKKIAPRPMQRHMRQAPVGSAILTAPTGSGKTEAALLWAAGQLAQQPSARLFYTLPYQASMNAMAERLSRDLFNMELSDTANTDVVVQHSRATLKYYRALMDADGGADVRAVTREAKARINQAKLNYYPIQVFSPYQMLKAAFQLRGYEPLLVDYTGALFIFDEIHAYEAGRLAQIITMMSWLREQFAARILVMTATLPPMIREKLRAALADPREIEADAELYRQSQRHRVHLLDGDLLDQLDRAVADWRAGRSPLICCNTVARAQQAYDRLKTYFGEDASREHIMLLHGRFNGRDRGEKERRLQEWVGVGTKNRAPRIVVATQVVEVSLNIDLDTLYSDPAPLEALLQRFGRVNRGRTTQEKCPVYVFRAPVGKTESRPYDHDLVSAGLHVLEQHCGGRLIDEAQVTRMLNEVYQGARRKAWEQAYDQAARSFQSQLDKIIPFQSASQALYHSFYEMFDGYQVVPAICEDEYNEARERHDYLGAMQYLVNISKAHYHMLRDHKLLRKEEEDFVAHVLVDYDDEYGLKLAEALKKRDEPNAEDDDV